MYGWHFDGSLNVFFAVTKFKNFRGIWKPEQCQRGGNLGYLFLVALDLLGSRSCHYWGLEGYRVAWQLLPPFYPVPFPFPPFLLHFMADWGKGVVNDLRG